MTELHEVVQHETDADRVIDHHRIQLLGLHPPARRPRRVCDVLPRTRPGTAGAGWTAPCHRRDPRASGRCAGAHPRPACDRSSATTGSRVAPPRPGCRRGSPRRTGCACRSATRRAWPCPCRQLAGHRVRAVAELVGGGSDLALLSAAPRVLPRSARDTNDLDTPAARATSSIVACGMVACGFTVGLYSSCWSALTSSAEVIARRTRFVIRLAGAPISWGVCKFPGGASNSARARPVGDARARPDRDRVRARGLPPGRRHRARRRCSTKLPAAAHRRICPLRAARPSRLRSRWSPRPHRSPRASGGAAPRTSSAAAVADANGRPRFRLSRRASSTHVATMMRRLQVVCRVRGHVGAPPAHRHADRDGRRRRRVLAVVGLQVVRRHRPHGDRWLRSRGVHKSGARSRRAGAPEGRGSRRSRARYTQRRAHAGCEAVQAGLFIPLGKGDVPVAEVIQLLEAGGYQGWYVLEQDLAITGDEPAYGRGPSDDVRESVAYLRSRFDVSRTS